MNLPDLKLYRLNFEKEGILFPLPVVPQKKDGLLHYLPIHPEHRDGWPWSEQTNPLVYKDRLNWPKLTIVTPSYNQEKFLEETIRSILLQNYPNLELIIIDGGSTDDSKRILTKYSKWISYWRSEKDEGQGQAINVGFSLASGDYYAWINSDDYYTKNTFFTVINQFIRSETDFIYGYGFRFDVVEKMFVLTKVLPLLDYLIKIPSLIQPSTFWNAAIHKPIWEELHCALDYELWLRLVKGKKRKLLKQPLSVAQAHDKAKTFNPEMKANWHEDHIKIWSVEGHGPVPEWKWISLLPVSYTHLRAHET